MLSSTSCRLTKTFHGLLNNRSTQLISSRYGLSTEAYPSSLLVKSQGQEVTFVTQVQRNPTV